MDWDNLSQQRKIEVIGKMDFDKHGEEGWENYNSFYTSGDGLVEVFLDNEEDQEDVVGDC